MCLLQCVKLLSANSVLVAHQVVTDGTTAVAGAAAATDGIHTVNMDHTANQSVKLSLTKDIIQMPAVVNSIEPTI